MSDRDRRRADAVYEALLQRQGERWVQPRVERTPRHIDGWISLALPPEFRRTRLVVNQYRYAVEGAQLALDLIQLRPRPDRDARRKPDAVISSDIVCNDNNPCTHTDRCSSGACSGTGYSCSTSDPCKTSTCNGSGPPPGGCTPGNRPNGTDCGIA